MQREMTKGRPRRRVVALTMALAVPLALAACGSTSKPLALTGAPPLASGSWPYPNGDLANTREAAGSTISSSNVAKLAAAWTFRLPSSVGNIADTGSLAANPVVVNGLVYLQDLDSNVYALGLTTGKLRWEYAVNEPIKSGPGPNGVAVVDGTVYGETPTAVFALNAATGKRIWVNGGLLSSGEGTFGIQPQVAGGRLYLASQLGLGPHGGILFALNASTGKLLWKFQTMLDPVHGFEGSGGAWETPLVGSDGSVTFGIGNPYQPAAEAIAEPSPQLYTDSDVNLDAATGQLRWYYQGVPNDFKDYDMQASPISAQIKGVPVVIGSGKMGYVYVMNAKTGALIWKTAVGEHNGHDNESRQALEHESSISAPYTYLPGSLGGVLSNLALADGTIYVATCDLPFRLRSLHDILGAPTESLASGSGEVEAISLATGKVEWDTKVDGLPFGAATVANDLVFTSLYPGVLLALNRNTGAVVKRISLPTSTNAPIAIAGNTVLVPAGGATAEVSGGNPQLVAYTVP